jgi:hypothetical protein
MPVIPATWEAEARGFQVSTQAIMHPQYQGVGGKGQTWKQLRMGDKFCKYTNNEFIQKLHRILTDQ